MNWIVVAKNHYDGLAPHVTLMSEELIGLHAFDNSDDRLNRVGVRGTNHWGESGTTDAEHGLRQFLNNLDKDQGYSYAGDGFYNAFSASFKNALLLNNLLNTTKFDSDGKWEDENPWTNYTTQDYVFVFSMTEYGEGGDKYPVIGSVIPYFDTTHSTYPKDWVEAYERGLKKATLGGEDADGYWSRFPAYFSPNSAGFCPNGSSTPSTSTMGLRPVVNVKSGIRVSEVPNEDGVYEFIW